MLTGMNKADGLLLPNGQPVTSGVKNGRRENPLFLLRERKEPLRKSEEVTVEERRHAREGDPWTRNVTKKGERELSGETLNTELKRKLATQGEKALVRIELAKK